MLEEGTASGEICRYVNQSECLKSLHLYPLSLEALIKIITRPDDLAMRKHCYRMEEEDKRGCGD
jgi:hypothetical protein